MHQQYTVPILKAPAQMGTPLILNPIIQEKIIKQPKYYYETVFIEDPRTKVIEKKQEDVYEHRVVQNRYVKKPVYIEKLKYIPKIITKEKNCERSHYVFQNKYVETPLYVNKTEIVNKPVPMVIETVIPRLNLQKTETVKYEDNENIKNMFLNYEKLENAANKNCYIMEACPMTVPNYNFGGLPNKVSSFGNVRENISEPILNKQALKQSQLSIEGGCENVNKFILNKRLLKNKQLVICDDIFKNSELCKTCFGANKEGHKTYVEFKPIVTDKLFPNKEPFILSRSCQKLHREDCVNFQDVVNTKNNGGMGNGEESTINGIETKRSTSCKKCLTHICTVLETFLQRNVNKHRKIYFGFLKNCPRIKKNFPDTHQNDYKTNSAFSTENKVIKTNTPSKDKKIKACDKRDTICYDEEIDKFINSLKKKENKKTRVSFPKNCEFLSYLKLISSLFAKKDTKKKESSRNCSPPKETDADEAINNIQRLYEFLQKDFELKKTETSNIIHEIDKNRLNEEVKKSKLNKEIKRSNSTDEIKNSIFMDVEENKPIEKVKKKSSIDEIKKNTFIDEVKKRKPTKQIKSRNFTEEEKKSDFDGEAEKRKVIEMIKQSNFIDEIKKKKLIEEVENLHRILKSMLLYSNNTREKEKLLIDKQAEVEDKSSLYQNYTEKKKHEQNSTFQKKTEEKNIKRSYTTSVNDLKRDKKNLKNKHGVRSPSQKCADIFHYQEEDNKNVHININTKNSSIRNYATDSEMIHRLKQNTQKKSPLNNRMSKFLVVENNKRNERKEDKHVTFHGKKKSTAKIYTRSVNINNDIKRSMQNKEMSAKHDIRLDLNKNILLLQKYMNTLKVVFDYISTMDTREGKEIRQCIYKACAILKKYIKLIHHISIAGTRKGGHYHFVTDPTYKSCFKRHICGSCTYKDYTQKEFIFVHSLLFYITHIMNKVSSEHKYIKKKVAKTMYELEELYGKGAI